MRKKKLVVDTDVQASVFGLVTLLKDYKLAWKINKALRTHLIKQPAQHIDFLTGVNLSVTNFDYRAEYYRVRLIKNKSSEDVAQYLIPELERFDYFIFIDGQEFFNSMSKLKGQLKEIDGIDYVHLVNVSKLKSKDNFIF